MDYLVAATGCRDKVAVKILLFARARELSGVKDDVMKLETPNTYEGVLTAITQGYTLQALRGNIVLAHNQEYIAEGAIITLKDGDEIAVIPPLSGETMNMEVKILNSEINTQELLLKVSQCGKGSVSLFVGTRKDISEKSALGSVTSGSGNEILQSYLVEVCREVSRRYNINFIAIHCSLIESFDVPCLAICCLAATYQIAAEAVNNAVDLINGQKTKFLCDDSNESSFDVVSSDLIQIKASSKDINHRISSFIERRRAQVNADNIRDFCRPKLSPDEISCARVDAVKIHRKDSSSHLRVRKVCNTWGPQTVSENNQSSQKVEVDHEIFKYESKEAQTNSSKDEVNKKVMLDERLKNIEEHVGSFSDSHGDVCTRLKRIEDKILFLEGLSPEYFNLGSDKSNKIALSPTSKSTRKRTYSAAELLTKIKELEGNMLK